MKKIKLIFSFILVLLVAISCTVEGISDDTALLGTESSANLNKIFDISTDNSGKVTITPTADGAVSFKVEYGHGTVSSVKVAPGASTTHVYPEGKYTVKITATSISGATTEQTFPLDVVYRAPENLAVTLNKNIHNLKVKAKADYAKSYLVYFGDVPNEVGTPLATDGEVAHDYAVAGTYNVKVVALSGGAAKTEKTTPTIIYNAYGLPITYELATQNYGVGGTFGGISTAVVANPFPTGLNTSATVWKYTKTTGAETWSGTYSTLDSPIDFATGNKIKLLMYATEVGKNLNVELEWAVGGTPANGVAVLKVANTVANSWQELVFDFSTIAAIPANAKFTQLVFRYDDSAKGSGEVIYIDNIRLTN
ncbi:hypothetical protein [Flavobacterium sp. LS1P3]|uniref:hypothetical protein n=1 Tax=Flavobacterium sp. LS1P3 TaxID=3401720 RepID=UPI003AB0788B